MNEDNERLEYLLKSMFFLQNLSPGRLHLYVGWWRLNRVSVVGHLSAKSGRRLTITESEQGVDIGSYGIHLSEMAFSLARLREPRASKRLCYNMNYSHAEGKV